MNEAAFPIHLILAVAVLGMDIIAAGIVFFILRRREHPFTFVIPAFILLAGVISAILVYFNLDQPPG